MPVPPNTSPKKQIPSSKLAAAKSPSTKVRCPLAHHTEKEIEHLLRGFSDSTVAGTLGLRTGSKTADFEACLFGILSFYRPAGSEELDGVPSGQTSLHQDLGLDSLSMLEAMFKVEELFDIHIENAELTKIATIDDARRLVEDKLQSQKSA